MAGHLGWNTKLLLLTGVFAALTAVGAFIKIPIPYVPITLQTFFVMLAANVLGPRYGALSQVIYLALGLIGLPVFAHGGGLMYILHPTFGYLAGFPLGAYLIGFILWKNRLQPGTGRIPAKLFLVNFLGALVILLVGVVYLYLNMNFILGTRLSWERALWIGFLVFVPGDILKVVIVSLIVFKYQKLLLQF